MPAPGLGDGSSGASSELLASVARRLHDLEGAAGEVAAELRRRVEAIGAPGTPEGSFNKVTHAVLRELLQTIAERAGGIEHEAELIAGILERAREQLEKARLESHPLAQHESSSNTPHQSSSEAEAVVDAIAPAPGAEGPPAASDSQRAQPVAPQPGDTELPHGVAPEGVKLLAVHMALAGTRSEEISDRLRREFGVIDPGPAVAEVFGGER